MGGSRKALQEHAALSCQVYIICEAELPNDSFVEVELKKGLKDALYDSLTYQLSLRCIHDLFKSDAESTVDEIQFIGYIRGVSAATGTDQETVILSARCTRQSFDKINLALVEPASFFLALQKATQTKPHLFKPVSLPAVVPNSGDDGLPLVRNATGELFCILSYAGQSVLARILASCRPDRWEHELTVELLRSMIREFTPKLKPNSPSALAEPTDAREFSELLSHAYERATAALNQIAEIVRDELMSSWGAPGIAGDAVCILIMWRSSWRPFLRSKMRLRVRQRPRALKRFQRR